MAADPYRSANGPFGRSLHVHRSSIKTSVRGFLFSVGLLVIGLAALVGGLEGWKNDALEDAVKPLVTLVASFMAIGCGAWGLVALVRSHDTRVDVCEHGIKLTANRRETEILWRAVREVRLHLRTERDHVSGLTVIANDGTRLTVGDELQTFDALRTAIERETTSRLLDEALARLAEDGAVTFGPFELTSEELRHAGQRLAWRDVERGLLTRGLLAVGSRGKALRVLPKRDGVLAWARAPAGAVPNPDVFLSLIKHLRRPDQRDGADQRDAR